MNLVAFYVVGMPLALTLAFPLRLGAAGLLLGLLAASAVQVRPGAPRRPCCRRRQPLP